MPSVKMARERDGCRLRRCDTMVYIHGQLGRCLVWGLVRHGGERDAATLARSRLTRAHTNECHTRHFGGKRCLHWPRAYFSLGLPRWPMPEPAFGCQIPSPQLHLLLLQPQDAHQMERPESVGIYCFKGSEDYCKRPIAWEHGCRLQLTSSVMINARPQPKRTKACRVGIVSRIVAMWHRNRCQYRP